MACPRWWKSQIKWAAWPWQNWLCCQREYITTTYLTLQEFSSSYSVAGEGLSSTQILLLKRRMKNYKVHHGWAVVFHQSLDCKRDRDNKILLLSHLLRVEEEEKTSHPGIQYGVSANHKRTCFMQFIQNFWVHCRNIALYLKFKQSVHTCNTPNEFP